MRIIAGEWRGRPLVAPEGRATRPTSDRAREGLLSMLASRLGSFDGLRAADLFAGTGALGLEALSRGAAHCLFVDNNGNAVAAIERNLKSFVADDRGDVRAQAVEYAPPPPAPCNLVFLDPPYSAGMSEAALARIANPAWLAPGALVSLETDRTRPAPPPGLEIETERRFGKAHLTLFRWAG
ncbi:MAG TPA: 16S rRNA (guanine(966)-N(2))-methyltransferase RsmD [Allosphingosinicella sp.]|jgi:16S rRNA (guanine966-N2)-methyltransferase|uniref:16S rRNA (guanine(966)-N(2))-methyltransferase RsmD n=1 Tax=Allosphingosinicella sp. TaxID=2823234 RepID=UPI002F299909